MLPHCSRKRDVCCEPLSFANFGIPENQSGNLRVLRGSCLASISAGQKNKRASPPQEGFYHSIGFIAEPDRTRCGERINSTDVFL